MKDGLDEVAGLSKVVGHEHEVVRVHSKLDDGVPSDLLLHR